MSESLYEARLSDDGRITLPKHRGDQLGLSPGTELNVESREDGALLRLKKAR